MKDTEQVSVRAGKYTSVSADRNRVFERVFAGDISQADAARMLGLTPARVSQLYAAWKKEGESALNNKHFGKPAPNRISDEEREEYRQWHRGLDVSAGGYSIALSRDRYEDKRGKDIKWSTARRILIEGGDVKPRSALPVV